MKKFITIILVNFIILSCSKKKDDDNNINNCETPSIAINVSGNAISTYISSGSNSYFEIEYGLTGFSHGSGTKLQSNSGSFNVTNLLKGTYDLYVRGNCGGSSFSNWSNVQSFVIVDGASASCNNPYNLVAYTPVSGYEFDWNGGSDYYDVEFGETGFTVGTGTRLRTNNTYTYARDVRFEYGKTYDFYVKGYCGTEYSSWVGPKSFYADENQNVCLAPTTVYASRASSTKINYSFSSTSGHYEVSLSTSPTTTTGTVYGITYTDGYFTGTFSSGTTYYFFVRTVCDTGEKSAWKIITIS